MAALSFCLIFAAAPVAHGETPAGADAAPLQSGKREYGVSSQFLLMTFGAAALLVPALWVGGGFIRRRRANVRVSIDVGAYPGMAWSKDAGGRFTAVSAALAEAYGIESPSEMIGKSDRDYWDIGDADANAAVEREVMRSKNARQIERAVSLVNGAIMQLQIQHIPTFGAGGAVAGTVGLIRGVSARKECEVRPDAHEGGFRTLTESSPDLIVRYDTQGRRLYMNPAMRAFAVAPHTEYLDQAPSDTGMLGGLTHKFLSFIPVSQSGELSSEDKSLPVLRRYEMAVRAVTESGRKAAYEMTWVDGKGIKHISHIVISPEKDGAGEVVSVWAVGRDITAQKEREELVRASERDFRTLAENSPDLILRYDLQMRRVYMNAAMLALDKRPSADFEGKTPTETGMIGSSQRQFLSFVPVGGDSGQSGGDDTDEPIMVRYEAAVRAVLESGERASYEIAWLEGDGRKGFDSITMAPEKNGAGDVTSVLVIGHDITAQKEREELVRASERDFRTLAENTPDTIARYDTDGKRVYANPALSALAKGDGIEVIGKRPSETGLEGVCESYDEAILRVARTGEAGEYDLQWRDAGGSEHLSLIRLVPEYGDTGEITSVLAIGRDMAERVQLEEELQAASRQLATIIDSVPGVIYRKEYAHDKANLLFISDRLGELTGISMTDLLGLEEEAFAEALWHPDDRAEVAVLSGKIHSGAPFAEAQARLAVAKGEYRWMRIVERVAEVREDGPIVTGLILDVDDEVTSRAAAELKDRQLATILNNLPDIAWLKDTDSRFTMVNHALATACGFDDPAQMIGKTDLDYFPKEQAEAYRADDAEVIRTKRPRHVDERQTREGGQDFWLETYKAPLIDGSGAVVGTVGIARDITERKEMEKRLEETSARLSSIIDSIPGLAYRKSYTKEGARFLFVSDQIRTRYGRDATLVYELDLEKRLSDIWHPDDGDTVREFVESMARGTQSGEIKIRMMVPDEGYRWVLIRERVTSVTEDEILTSGLLIDIDDQVRAEERNELLRDALNHAGEVAVLCNETGRIEYVNAEATTLTGYGEDELLNMHVYDVSLGFPAEKWPDHWRELQQRKSMTFEDMHQRKDGSVYPVEVNVSLVAYQGRELNLAFARDITKRKRMEGELRRTSEQMRAIIDSVPGIVYHKVYAREGSRMTFLSQHMHRVYGIPIDELVGKPEDERISMLWHPDDQEQVWQLHQRIRDGAPMAERRGRIVAPDGTYKWMYVREVVNEVHDGDIAITGLIFDIDDQVRAQEDLDSIVRQFPGSIFRIHYDKNDRKRFLFIDGTLARATSEFGDWAVTASHEELLESFPESTRELLFNEFPKLLREQGHAEGILEFPEDHPMPRLLRVREEVRSIDENGEMITEGVAIDVTDEVETKEKLGEASRNLESIVKNFPGSIFRMHYDENDHKRFLFIDGASARETPEFRDWAVTASHEELHAGFNDKTRDILFNTFPKQLREQGYVEAIVEFPEIDQRVSWMRIREEVRSIDENGEMITEGVTIDVTDELLSRQALEQEEAERGKLQASLVEERHMADLGRLAGGIAHDFNNLLGAISGFANFIAEDAAGGTPSKKYAERILAASERGCGVVKQVMTVTGQATLDKSRFKLADQLEESRGEINGTVSSSVKTAIGGTDADLELVADRTLLGEALYYLCLKLDIMSNGRGDITIGVRRARLDGEVARRFSVRRDENFVWSMESWEDDSGVWAITGNPDTEKDYLFISILNEGRCMNANAIRNAFVPYYSTYGEVAKSSFGLSIAQGMALMHDGALVVHSENKRGTTVEILLPTPLGS